jgi:hypothetical protein
MMLTMLVTVVGGSSPTAEPVGRPKGDTVTYALIVSGINKDLTERQAKNKAVADFSRFLLERAGVKPDRLGVLVPNGSSVQKDAKISTADNLKEQVRTFAEVIAPEDRFIFYYVGQANIVQDKLRLNLPGVDITHEQLAEWMNGLKVSSMLVVLDCPGAEMAVKALTGPDRVIIGARTAEQRYSTRFSQYFIPALSDDKSDTDGDGKISALEAFNIACKQLDELYRSQGLLKTETPVLEDDGDGTPSQEPWRHEQDKTDGAAAARFFLSGKS